jgi:hypothetical protein
VWAEVLTLGPSRATIASSLSLKNLWQIASQTGRVSKVLVLAVAGMVTRKRVERLKKKRADSESIDRRKSNPSLPTIATSNNSPTKSAQKSASKTVKSA